MYVRAGSLVRHGCAKRIVRDALQFQIMHQPAPLGLIGGHRDIHPATMVEAERTMDRCLAIGADRKGLRKPHDVSSLENLQIVRGKNPVPFVLRVHVADPLRMRLNLAFDAGDRLFPANGFRQIRHQLCARLRPFQFLLRPFQIDSGGFRFGSGNHAGAYQLLHIVQSALAAQNHALRDQNHLIGLLGQKVGAVQTLFQDGAVERIEDVFLGLAEPYRRQGSRRDEPRHLIEDLAGADHGSVERVSLQRRRLRRGRRWVRLSKKDRNSEDRQGGKSEVHAYLYSTIAVGGEFLPHIETNVIDSTSTQQQPEAGWLIAVRAAREKQATDIKVLDLTGVTSFTDYFVICTGANTRQNQAITDEIGQQLKRRGELPTSVEGYDQGEWVLSDFGDFLVHVFSAKAREYYSLERLWRDAKDVAIPAE
jgi:ribosome-associated protein